jgi:hypothetical protein
MKYVPLPKHKIDDYSYMNHMYYSSVSSCENTQETAFSSAKQHPEDDKKSNIFRKRKLLKVGEHTCRISL